MGGVDQANDVLQETNLRLCAKASDYEVGRPFLPWAYTFARWEVMAWRKRQQRSRLVLDDGLAEQLAEEFQAEPAADGRLRALEECLSQLPRAHRELIQARYQASEAVQDMAVRLKRPENTVSAMLYRIRRTLAECVHQKTRKERMA
jgi:RNA polymerase sigma-70 factor (ECF subfamily)